MRFRRVAKGTDLLGIEMSTVRFETAQPARFVPEILKESQLSFKRDDRLL